jgi:hypothetical protein
MGKQSEGEEKVKVVLEEYKVQNRALAEENRRLGVENERLQKENGTVQELQKIVDKLVEENRLLKDALEGADGREEVICALRKRLEESGAAVPGIPDDNIRSAFEQLYQGMYEFVVEHCRNHGSRRGQYGALDPGAKDQYVMGIIADHIYADLFTPAVRPFGFGPQWDMGLRQLEEGLLGNNRGMASICRMMF